MKLRTLLPTPDAFFMRPAMLAIVFVLAFVMSGCSSDLGGEDFSSGSDGLVLLSQNNALPDEATEETALAQNQEEADIPTSREVASAGAENGAENGIMRDSLPVLAVTGQNQENSPVLLVPPVVTPPVVVADSSVVAPVFADSAPLMVSSQVPVIPQGGALLYPMRVRGGWGDDLGTTVISGSDSFYGGTGAPGYFGGGDPFSSVTVYEDVLDEGPGGGAISRPEGTLVAVIQFKRGSSALGARDRKILQQVVALLRQTGGRLHVVGHASSFTADMPVDRHLKTNFAISSARARSVADVLRRFGAPPGSIDISAASDSDPVYYEVMPSGEAGNRRAEIYLQP